MNRYRLSRSAKADLDKIWLYIAANASLEIADRRIEAITDRFRLVAGMPDAGRVSEMEPESRVFPAESYLIYYRRSREGGVLISRIIHGMRDQRKAWVEGEE